MAVLHSAVLRFARNLTARRTRRSFSTLALTLVALAFVGTGCASTSKVTNRRLIQHQAMIDFSGLKAPETLQDVRVTCSVPSSWSAMPLKKTGLYAHQQWKSPSTNSGIGVVHVKLPLPLGEKTILWLAKQEYTKKSNDGKEVAQWTDTVGRHWFEAENNQYHVQGYVIARGFNAWLVYFGYKTHSTPDVAELSLAARCAESFIPDFKVNQSPSPKGEPVTVSAED